MTINLHAKIWQRRSITVAVAKQLKIEEAGKKKRKKKEIMESYLV